MIKSLKKLNVLIYKFNINLFKLYSGPKINS